VHWKGGGKSKKKGRLSQVAQEQQAAEKAHEERICCPVRRLHPGTTWPPRGQAPPAGPTSSAARLSGPARARLAGSASTGAPGRHRRGPAAASAAVDPEAATLLGAPPTAVRRRGAR
jgi:hypothetical protein